MKEQNISEAQSLNIITSMIAQTKSRIRIGDGNLFLLWGWLVLGVLMLGELMLYLTHHLSWHYLSFIVYVCGFIFPAMLSRRATGGEVITYTDRISGGVWRISGIALGISYAFCLVMSLCHIAFACFFLRGLTLLIVGMAVAIQGMIIKEKSLIRGGSVGILSSCLILAVANTHNAFAIQFGLILFVVAWICVMIVPGYYLNAKARKS